MKQYFCKSHKIYDFVDREIFLKYGSKSWIFIDPRLPWTIDKIEDFTGKRTKINNWMEFCYKKSIEEIEVILQQENIYQQRGFRNPWCRVGNIISQHRFGRALDFEIEGMEPSEVQQMIIENQDKEMLQYVTQMECQPDKTHIDTRQTGASHILVYRPKVNAETP